MKAKRRIFVALGILLAAGLLGFLVAASGVVPIKASAGHWAITEWFLEFSMERSVATHSLGIKPPPLDRRELVLKGATHFEIGCRPCHGSPEFRTPRIASHMLPHPPYLPEVVPQWEDAELFYIVKHGVKMTGMPAWPAQKRDDEAWALAAFLRKLPEMSLEEYRELAHGDAETGIEDATAIADLEGVPQPTEIIETCRRCHGRDGNGRGAGAFPKLAGQRPEYLEASLAAYADGERHSGIMEPIAAGCSQRQRQEISRYYSELEWQGGTPGDPDEATAAAIERGRLIAHEGVPEARIPACMHCHGPSDVEHNPHYPRLAGQYAKYIELQLDLFKQDHRGGTQYAHLMHPVASSMSKEQMHDVALYYEHAADGEADGE